MLSNNDKDQIIAMIVAFQKVMASKNVTVIRTYLSSNSDAATNARLQKLDDPDLLQGAEMFASLGGGNLTEAQLRASSTQWTYGNNKATTAVPSGDNSTDTFHAVNENGRWVFSAQ